MPNTTNDLKWFPKFRLAWLERYAKKNGAINRQDLVDAFKISFAQASSDLQKYIELNSRALTYDLNNKEYVWDKSTKLYFPKPPIINQFS